jgi:ACS family tartrate transporter-like MFS transporter
MSDSIERMTMRRVSFRLLPLLFLVYAAAYLDRSNVGIAALQMNDDLGFGPATFGFGAGIFFLGYAAFEVPSNLILVRVGARKWIARIAITWGLVVCAMIWVRTPGQFYAARFFLGIAEAGFFPGFIYYVSRWFPGPYRARAVAAVTMGIPLSQVIGGALGGPLLGLRGVAGLSGWQWLFLMEGLPPILLGLLVLRYLTEIPGNARWLAAEQRAWICDHIEHEQQGIAQGSTLRALGSPIVWALSLPYFALFAVGNIFVFWAPILVHGALGTSNTMTGFVVATISLVALPVYPIAAHLSDRSDERCRIAALGLALQCVGCLGLAVFPDSLWRVISLALLPIGTAIFVSSFWCLPPRFLKGAPAAAGIALISSIGTSGGFFGPSIVGYLKQMTGTDSGAFVGLAALSFAGASVCLAFRQAAAFKPVAAM